MKTLRIASRASKLAIVQAGIVKDILEKVVPQTEILIEGIHTRGDRDRSDFLYKSEFVGLFTSDVENALLDGRADLAVHSLKDLPTAGSGDLTVAAILKREFVEDALIAKDRAKSIRQLSPGAAVGTSSLRRIAQLKHARSDLKCVPLRGNVETRVRKVAAGQVDAAVIACAGLSRLGLSDRISAVLPPDDFLTAPGQGALAVQVRTADTRLRKIVCQLDDEPTRIATEAERTVLAAMRGGCSIPLGVYAAVSAGSITIHGMIADLEGKQLIRRSASGLVAESKDCALRLTEGLLEAGGQEILQQIRLSRTKIPHRPEQT